MFPVGYKRPVTYSEAMERMKVRDMAKMSVTVRIADMEPFQDFIRTVKKAFDSPGVPQSVKDEIDAAINKLEE